jgi:hypothetical protein
MDPTEDMYLRPIDWYQNNVNIRSDMEKKTYPRGASTLTRQIAKEELEKLAKLKKRAEMDAKYWESRGDKERAQMAKDQYIEEKFLPAVELVIVASTPDEVLNAKDILKAFDDLSMQYGPGYTESYIRTAYEDQRGNTVSQSDGYVRDNISQIRHLANTDQIRSAYSLAKRIKDEVDKGQHTSSDSDYEILTRVASIG